MLQFLPLIISAIAAYAGSRGNNSSGSTTGGASNPNGGTDIDALMKQFPEMGKALSIQTSQMERQDPLHAALTQLGMNLLPSTAYGPRKSGYGNITPWQGAHAFPGAAAGGSPAPAGSRPPSGTPEGFAMPRPAPAPRGPSAPPDPRDRRV